MMLYFLLPAAFFNRLLWCAVLKVCSHRPTIVRKYTNTHRRIQANFALKVPRCHVNTDCLYNNGRRIIFIFLSFFVSTQCACFFFLVLIVIFELKMNHFLLMLLYWYLEFDAKIKLCKCIHSVVLLLVIVLDTAVARIVFPSKILLPNSSRAPKSFI